jgi:hypothetical protein
MVVIVPGGNLGGLFKPVDEQAGGLSIYAVKEWDLGRPLYAVVVTEGFLLLRFLGNNAEGLDVHCSGLEIKR